MVFLITPRNVEGKVILTATGETMVLTQHNGLMETSCPKLVSLFRDVVDGKWVILRNESNFLVAVET
jgi:hypothetical protein